MKHKVIDETKLQEGRYDIRIGMYGILGTTICGILSIGFSVWLPHYHGLKWKLAIFTILYAGVSLGKIFIGKRKIEHAETEVEIEVPPRWK